MCIYYMLDYVFIRLNQITHSANQALPYITRCAKEHIHESNPGFEKQCLSCIHVEKKVLLETS